MGNLTRDEILARKVGRAKVELPGGGTVSIRALTFREVADGQEIKDITERTAFYVAAALTDPVMSADDVAAWAGPDGGDAGDMTYLSEQIQMISRLSEGAGKRGVQRAGKRR